MADGAIVAVPRATQTGDQNVETIEQDRDAGGIRLVQSVALPCLTGSIGTHTAVTVGVASGTVLAANEKRMSAFIRNFGTVTIYLSFDGGAAVVASDMPLYVGESFEVRIYAGLITGISGTGGQDVRVVEFDLP